MFVHDPREGRIINYGLPKKARRASVSASRPLHCYPSISRIFARIFSPASTQRRKDAKTQRGECMLIWSFGSESLRLCVFASLRLCVFALNSLGCGSPRCGLLVRHSSERRRMREKNSLLVLAEGLAGEGGGMLGRFAARRLGGTPRPTLN